MEDVLHCGQLEHIQIIIYIIKSHQPSVYNSSYNTGEKIKSKSAVQCNVYCITYVEGKNVEEKWCYSVMLRAVSAMT